MLNDLQHRCHRNVTLLDVASHLGERGGIDPVGLAHSAKRCRQGGTDRCHIDAQARDIDPYRHGRFRHGLFNLAYEYEPAQGRSGNRSGFRKTSTGQCGLDSVLGFDLDDLSDAIGAAAVHPVQRQTM
jgi:hypothetical protein